MTIGGYTVQDDPTNSQKQPRRKRHLLLRIDSWIDSTVWNLGFRLGEIWEEITIFFRRFRVRGWKKAVFELAGEAMTLRLGRGVVALDGEREVEFAPADKVVVRLAEDGPLSVDIERTMMLAAQNGLFVRDRPATRGVGARTA